MRQINVKSKISRTTQEKTNIFEYRTKGQRKIEQSTFTYTVSQLVPKVTA